MGGMGFGPGGGGPPAPAQPFTAPKHTFGDRSNFPLTAVEYRQKHDLTVVSRAGAPPDPLQTFEAAGFTEDIMREARGPGGGACLLRAAG